MEKNMKKRIALVGCAHIHTPSFVKMLLERKEEFDVAGVWDPEQERAQKNADQLNCRVCLADSEIWNDPSIDAVVICSETKRHEELVRKAVAAKKHMFVEKPLGFAAGDAREMAEQIENAGLLFQTGYFRRGDAIFQFLREQIQNGAFGTISRIRMTNCHSGSLGGWFDSEWRWMADPAIAGCGAFGDLGTHVLDIMMWFLGKPELVTADIRPVTARYGTTCDETGEAILQFPNGTIGTLAAGWVDLADPDPCQISGTEGHAVVINGQLFFKSSHVEGADGSSPWTKLPEGKPHAFQRFLNAIAGQKEALVSPREAAERSAVMEALYQASRDKSWKKPVY